MSPRPSPRGRLQTSPVSPRPSPRRRLQTSPVSSRPSPRGRLQTSPVSSRPSPRGSSAPSSAGPRCAPARPLSVQLFMPLKSTTSARTLLAFHYLVGHPGWTGKGTSSSTVGRGGSRVCSGADPGSSQGRVQGPVRGGSWESQRWVHGLVRGWSTVPCLLGPDSLWVRVCFSLSRQICVAQEPRTTCNAANIFFLQCETLAACIGRNEAQTQRQHNTTQNTIVKSFVNEVFPPRPVCPPLHTSKPSVLNSLAVPVLLLNSRSPRVLTRDFISIPVPVFCCRGEPALLGRLGGEGLPLHRAIGARNREQGAVHSGT